MMMRYFLSLFLFLLIACDFQGNNSTQNLQFKDDIEEIFGKFDIKGTILVYDAKMLRDWHIYAEWGQVLIKKVRPLYAKDIKR